ncbi:MAG: bifunctional precorrin-2 dehydrogenase/sirohydrochlorin ferrochelatase [Acidimicrobiia bacterium]|nr:bifunctional precorrin-2 dehydrogenase/sirohydrochlorin ferrochelatase [Acidimicrobiia bacterium]
MSPLARPANPAAPPANPLARPPARPAASYPVNLDLAGAPVLVVGGGPVAARKVDGLLASGAEVTVVAPACIDALVDRPAVRCVLRPYRSGDVAGHRLVIAATGIDAVDRRVHADATATGVLVNVADRPELCGFTLPSVLRRGRLQVAVSTNAASPAFASWLRRRLEADLDEGYEAALDLLADVRAELRAAGRSTELPGWHAALDGGLVELVAAGRHAEARARLRGELGLSDPAHSGPASAPRTPRDRSPDIPTVRDQLELLA